MNYQAHYEKRRRERWPWPLLLGVVLSSAVLFWFGLRWILPQPSVQETAPFTICGKSRAETLSEFKTEDSQDKMDLNDVLVYGETLNLYQSPYALGVTDGLAGKTIILHNLCDGYEWVYMMEKTIDGQIPLEQLPNGFYQVFVLDDLKRKVLVSESAFRHLFYPVRRDGKSKEVLIVADKTLIVDEEGQPVHNENQLYVNVVDVDSEETETIYDVVIDPAHSAHVNGSIEKGHSAFNMIEANETLRMANLLKEELEAMGLKVYLTRDDTIDVVDLYGVDGRLDRAYQSKAKYYLELNMNFSTNESIRGVRIQYSSYASNKFATSLFKSYMETEGLVPYGNGSKNNIPGVVASTRYNGWDAIPVLRETGGRILAAGTISALAQEQNASFNKDAMFGMQAVSLDLIFISNETDATIYANRSKEMAHNLALGFADYLGLTVNP